MCDIRNGAQIHDNTARISEAFDKNRLTFRRERTAEILRLGRVHEMAGPAKFLEAEGELRERPAIKIAAGEEFIAWFKKREEGDELRRMAGSGGNSGAPAFKACDTFFQNRDGRVGKPRIDMAEIMQVEQGSCVIHIVKHEACRLINRRTARAGGGIGRGTCMDAARGKTIIQIARRQRAIFAPAIGGWFRRSVADKAGIHTTPG